VTKNMTNERGYLSALSACPQPAAAVAAGQPAGARLRAVGVDVRPHLDAPDAPAQGTGLPITGLPIAVVADLPVMTLIHFVQPHPGFRARRHPV
jgi:hypothetical protein